MEQREKLINLIIEAVSGCARYWAVPPQEATETDNQERR